ncbi:MAG: hypothetical protein GPJ21_12030 [Microcystis aeruginosa W13-11]|nr:hypothetical protein [Microcystis aeruginosa W13-11]
MIMIYPSEITKKWPHRPLSEVVDFLDSKRKPITQKDRVPGPYPYYGANGQQDSVADYIFDEPLVLLAEDGGHFGDADKTIAYQVEGKCWVNNHAHVLRPKKDVDIRYICRHLERYDVTPFITGSTRGKLTKTAANNIPIALPPLEEQRRIAAILDKADGVRRKRKEAIRLTKELLRSTFLEMFGDPVTNPKGWEIVKLEKVSESISYGITASADFVPTATKMLRITDIQNGEINWESVPFCSGDKKDIQKYSIVSGDIVFARTGATTGKSFLIRHCPENTLFASYLIRVRPSSLISPEYLAYFFKTEFYWKQIQQNSSGSAQPGVNSSKLKELLIILPPIELQKGFARLDIFIQNNLMKMNNFLHQQDNLFNSLLQKAFRGEL